MRNCSLVLKKLRVSNPTIISRSKPQTSKFLLPRVRNIFFKK